MRRTAIRVALAALMVLSAMPAVTAAAGGQGAPGSPSLDSLLVDHLNLLPEQVSRWRENLIEVGDEFVTFARGGDAAVPAEVDIADVPWFRPLAFGANYVQWQGEGSTPDVGSFQVVDGVLGGDSGIEPRVGAEYLVMTAVMAADIPIDDPEDPQQWDFVLEIPGMDAWEALPQFPDDTWNGGSFVLSLRYENAAWDLRYFTFPDGAIVEQEYPGFGFIAGDTIVLAVEADPAIFMAAPEAQGAPGGDPAALGRMAGTTRAGQRVELSGRLALDSPRLVAAAPGTRDAFFTYLGSGAAIVPGLLGFFDIVEFDVFVDGDGYVWIKFFPYTGWGSDWPVPAYFSYYLQAFVRGLGSADPPHQFGVENHDGGRRTFSYDGSEEGDPVPAYIMDDGAILIRSNYRYSSGDLEVFVSSGALPTEDGQFRSTGTQAMVPGDTVDTSDEPTRYDGEYPVFDLATGEAVDPPQELTTTSSSTTLAVTATTAASGGSPPGSGGMSPFVIIVIILIAIALLWLFWRWYQAQQAGSPRGSSTPAPGIGRTRTRGAPDDHPHDTPSSTARGEHMDHEECGWGLYFHDGTQEIPVREPGKHQHLCCKYVVRVTTDVRTHAQAARGRQDTGADRLRIPDFDYAWRWVDISARTSTRSGPAGRLDWMQGLGDPIDESDIPLDPYWQKGPEPPEVAAHLAHREITDVDITLEAKCPEYKNVYGVSAESALELLATQECTNDAGDPCPVELNAFGFVGGWIIGPGNIFTGAADWTGTDPDELERSPLAEARTRAGATPHLPFDGHDHGQKDRAAYEVSERDRASDALEQDDLSITIENDVEIDAGQIVPPEVYATTERVTAHIEGSLTHDLQIQVDLTPIDCEKNNCGGHGDCACKARWKMRVSGSAGSWIDAGDGPFEILRDPTAADRGAPATGKRSWLPKS